MLFPQIKHLHYSETQISNTVVAMYKRKEVGWGRGGGIEAKKKRKHNNKCKKHGNEN